MSARDLTPEELRRWPLPKIAVATDKEIRGRVLVVGGAAQVAGAVLLTGTAALRTGAGKLQIAASASCAIQLAVSMPEARVFGLPETADSELAPAAADLLVKAVGRSDAIVIGPGLLDDASAGELAMRLLRGDGPPIVIDAAAMPAFVRAPDRATSVRGRLVLTPHAGEMAGLAGVTKAEIEADPLTAARIVAAEVQGVVALKGAETFIVSPDGQAWRYVSSCGTGHLWIRRRAFRDHWRFARPRRVPAAGGQLGRLRTWGVWPEARRTHRTCRFSRARTIERNPAGSVRAAC